MSDRGEPIYKTRPVAPSPAQFGRCERVDDVVSMSEGFSNTYLIETGGGNVLVNTGMGMEAPIHHANFTEMAGEIDGTIRYVAVTQGHTDHVGGVQYFRDRNPDLELVAQANNVEHQAYDKRLGRFRQARSAFRFAGIFTQAFQDWGKAGYTDMPPQDEPTADVTFDERIDLSLGGEEIVAIGQPGAETNDSLVVWLPRTRTVLTGNIFGCPFGHFPNLVTIRGDRYREALVCADAAQTVLDLEPETICYGHHAPVVGADLVRREVTAYRDAIHFVHDAVVDGMNAGKDLATIQQEVQLPAELEVGEGYGMVRWSARAIWESYAGWFKHESTTELYDVPQRDVHADLVELAGADALVDRARAKFAAGEREAALHLLDILRNAAPENDAARKLALEVHAALLEDARSFKTTGNFWLEGWLEKQIDLLQGGEDVSLGSLIR